MDIATSDEDWQDQTRALMLPHTQAGDIARRAPDDKRSAEG
jgi:hypothetical protein